MGAFGNDWASMAWAQFWQVTVVAMAAGALAWLVGRRRPHLAYVLWLLVIVKCLTPPIWSSPVGVFSWAGARIARQPDGSIQPASSTLNPPQSMAEPPVAEIAQDFSSRATPYPPDWVTAAPKMTDPDPVAALPAPDSGPAPPTSNWSDRFPVTAILGVIWLLGAAVYLAVVARRMWRWKSAVRRSPIADPKRRAAFRVSQATVGAVGHEAASRPAGHYRVAGAGRSGDHPAGDPLARRGGVEMPGPAA